MGFDAFNWVKDSNLVLATAETKNQQKNVSIYPNPTKGPLSIKAEKNTKAEIYSPEGKLLKTISIQKGINNTDISELPKGIYIIKTETESVKVIKN